MKTKFKIKKILDFLVLVVGIVIVGNIMLYKSLPFIHHTYTREDASYMKNMKQFQYLYTNIDVYKTTDENLKSIKNKAEEEMLEATIAYRNLCLNFKSDNYYVRISKDKKNIIKLKKLCDEEYKNIINKIYEKLTKKNKK